MKQDSYEYMDRLMKAIRAVVTFEPGKLFGCTEMAKTIGLPVNMMARLLKA